MMHAFAARNTGAHACIYGISADMHETAFDRTSTRPVPALNADPGTRVSVFLHASPFSLFSELYLIVLRTLKAETQAREVHPVTRPRSSPVQRALHEVQ